MIVSIGGSYVCNIVGYDMERRMKDVDVDSWHTKLVVIAPLRFAADYSASYRNREAAQPRQGGLPPRGCTTCYLGPWSTAYTGAIRPLGLPSEP